MEEVSAPKAKNSIFKRIIGLINKLMPQEVEKSAIEGSHFELYLRQVDKKHESYEIVKKACELCDEALVIAKQRISIIKRIHRLEEKMIELECYDKLSGEEIENLKSLIERFVGLTKDRNALRYQITGFDKGLEDMAVKEDDAKYVLQHMEDSEKNQRILRQDINLLRGEKGELEYEFDQMVTAQNFIYRLSIFMVIFFALGGIGLAYMYFVNQASIFFPTAILCMLLILIVSFIYVFKQRIRYELNLNVLKQQKAVDIINKKNVVLAYHTNFLKYVYKKYNVRNSVKLKKNLRDYSDYKHITYRFDSIRNAMYQTEYEIESFLREKNISNAMITIEKFAKTIDIDDKRRVYHDYETEKNRLEARLEDLDKVHDSIWTDLAALNEFDTTPERLVDKVTQQYTEEVSNIAKINMDFDEDSENEEEEVEPASAGERVL